MNLRAVAETTTTITVGWDPVAGQEGYVPTIDGSEQLLDGKRHASISKTATSCRIGRPQDGKPHTYGIRILGAVATGALVSPAPPPIPPPATTMRGGIANFAEGDYVYRDSLKSFDVYMTDLNGLAAPHDLPGVRVLFYRSMCSINRDYNNSMPHDLAASSGWLLPGIVNRDYPTNDILDISNAAASQAMADDYVKQARQSGFKGVWMDDCVYVPGALLNAMPAGWTTDKWQTSLYQHVGIIGKTLKANGLDLVANANGFIPGDGGSDNGDNDLAFWTKLAPLMTGLTKEYWNQRPDNLAPFTSNGGWDGNWGSWRRLHQLCNSAGVRFHPVCYAETGSAAALFFRASFLLDWDPARGSAIFSGTHANQGEPAGAWSKDLGSPTGLPLQAGSRWTRAFERGTVSLDSAAVTASY